MGGQSPSLTPHGRHRTPMNWTEGALPSIPACHCTSTAASLGAGFPHEQLAMGRWGLAFLPTAPRSRLLQPLLLLNPVRGTVTTAVGTCLWCLGFSLGRSHLGRAFRLATLSIGGHGSRWLALLPADAVKWHPAF